MRKLVKKLVPALVLLSSSLGANVVAGEPAVATFAKAREPVTIANRRATVTIDMLVFSSPTKAAPGQRVRIRNLDPEPHSITSDDGGDTFNVPVDSDARAHFHAPMQLGRYHFHCNFHAGMSGVLVVKR